MHTSYLTKPHLEVLMPCNTIIILFLHTFGVFSAGLPDVVEKSNRKIVLLETIKIYLKGVSHNI
jgi:hypothetical protein